ncbi:ROK family protein [Limnochorda pilosa]|uniref:ROK family protein n=1 Tax=Limnochorda pilosa TaxID=1555112 RepID=A0A0K2SKJ6_LIMPI|nr:ROK family protein [Limnochorda pilosa]BAS27364.1 ROK family protein [Limnochorda pilosa]
MPVRIDPHRSRQLNRLSILQLLRAHGELSGYDLARRTGLSRTAAYNVVDELLASATVRERLGRSRGGRRPVLYSLNPDTGFVIGVDLGGSRIRAESFSFDEKSVASSEVPMGLTGNGGVLSSVLEAVGNVTSSLPGPVLGIGIAAPGLVDASQGMVLQAANLGWQDVPLAQILSGRFGRPVIVDNDTNAATLAETRFGAGRGHRNVVYVRADTGIGAGLVLDGKLYRGELGVVGEVGHTVLEPDGALCACGRRGCLETLASVPAMVRRYRALRGETGPGELRFKDLTSRAYAGDEAARVTLRESGRWLGHALGNVANLLGPSAILLAGQVAGGGPLLWEPLLAELRHRALSPAAGQIWVARGELKERAGTVGAAQLVFEQVFSPDHEDWLPALRDRQAEGGSQADQDEGEDGGGARESNGSCMG